VPLRAPSRAPGRAPSNVDPPRKLESHWGRLAPWPRCSWSPVNEVPTMQKKQTERLAVPPARGASIRRPGKSAAPTVEALVEGRTEAVGVQGMIDLQRTVGNRAVSGLIGESSGVVARWPVAAAAPAVKVDDEDAMQQLTPMALILVYISTDDQLTNGEFQVPHTSAAFTKKFIVRERAAMLELIAEKMEGQHDQAGFYGEIVRSKPGDKERKGKVEILLAHEYRQDLKERLNEEESTMLRENTKDEILDSMSALGSACQNQKTEVRAEMAEEAELFAFILEIAFSFVPVAGKALGKGLGKLAAKGMKPETLKKIHEVAEWGEALGAKEAVEGALKEAQRALKSAHSSHQSEGEQFIGKFESEARKASKDVRAHVDRMKFGEMTHTLADFSERDLEFYEAKIAEALLKYKKSAGHIGETRYWEFGRPGRPTTMGGETQAAKIQTIRGKRIALITYEMRSPYDVKPSVHGQPVFLDWVPKDMEEMTVAKSKNKYGEPMELNQGDYKIPPEYNQRWLYGLIGATK
jgi:hypothetical protein